MRYIITTEYFEDLENTTNVGTIELIPRGIAGSYNHLEMIDIKVTNKDGEEITLYRVELGKLEDITKWVKDEIRASE